MALESCLSANLSTNIEITNRDTGELLCKTSNTLTNKGKSLIGNLLTTQSKIDSIILSNTVNTGVTQLMFADAVYLDVVNSYSTISTTTGVLTINIEASADGGVFSGTLNSIGLAVGDVLFSVADGGAITIGANPISVLYQIKLELTQGV